MVFDLVSPPPQTACSGGVSASQDKQGLFSSCFTEGRSKAEFRFGFGFGSEKEASSESSSIGAPDDSDDDNDDEDEVQSKPKGSLGSLASLEDSLPIKKGLSSNYTGKSRSFANLSEVSRVEELKKKENPLNKRRRTMIAYKWTKKSAFYGCGNNSSMPLLALNEEDEEKSDLSQDEEEDDDDEDEAERRRQIKVSKSCFSLTDLRK